MRLIDGDQMAVDETEAYMAAQEQIDDPYWQRANLIVHAKVQKLIADTPTIDAVPVVRCRECIYYKNHPNGLCYLHTEASSNKEGFKGDVVCVNSDDFCSYGQRRDQSAEARNMGQFAGDGKTGGPNDADQH